MSAAPATAVPIPAAMTTPSGACPVTSPKKFIVFDMDGVLLDSEPIYLSVEGAFIERLAGPSADIHEILPQLLGRTSPDLARIAIDHFNLKMDVATFLATREASLRPAFANCPLLPGAEAFVRRIDAAGVRMAVATSGARKYLDAKRVCKEDFFGLFEGIFCSDDVKAGKPDPEIFLKAAEVIGVAPGKCDVFEDAPAGVLAAKTAGMTVVAFPNPSVDKQLYVDAGFDCAVEGWRGFQPRTVGLPDESF